MKVLAPAPSETITLGPTSMRRPRLVSLGRRGPSKLDLALMALVRETAGHHGGVSYLIYGEPAKAADDGQAWRRVRVWEAMVEELNAELMRVRIEDAELATELRIITNRNIHFGGHATDLATGGQDRGCDLDTPIKDCQ